MSTETGNHEQVLQDLKSFIADTKILIERVMKMRIECKEVQMTMLRLFNPKCIKILEISNEVSRKNTTTVRHFPEHRNIKTKLVNLKKSAKVHFE
ncbi:uncharacterized protein LOC106645830 [Copidosoma floridanum]|uniref:uncharacterized protein LOC106645830 n=1 Tax=Copidosoma floridanum TaxID=29053 RepID=UPI0006C9A6B3|nr:uncharacterized protein LOC106645830 [Copidosoma floridanum]